MFNGGLDVTVPHEFLVHGDGVPTAPSHERFVCRKLCVPSLPIPDALFIEI
jgi:hypothetical protein